MTEIVSIDSVKTHNHRLEEGFKEDCPACLNLVETTAQDLAIHLTIHTTDRFDNTSARIAKVLKAIERLDEDIYEIGREIDHPHGQEMQISYSRLRECLTELRAGYPERDGKRTETPLEFLMAVYFAEFQQLPQPKFKKGCNETDIPSNQSTKFIKGVWNSAVPNLEVEQALDRKHFPVDHEERGRMPAATTGDFGKTMQVILDRWSGSPPKPEVVLGLVGDISMWSGGDEN